MTVVLARGLEKRYGDFEAVKGVTFEVRRGEVYGLLGPNGAGKTSTLRVLTGLAPASGGSLTVLGQAIPEGSREAKRRLGVVPQESNLDADMRVDDQLLAHARFYSIPRDEARARIARLLALLDLEEKATARVVELSGGMKRRLLIARALVNDPELLVLDEPTVGLDPQSRHLLWERIRDFRRLGRTVILSTHYMDEAAALCDRLAILHEGRILVEGAPQALVTEHVARDVLEVEIPAAAHARLLAIAGGRGESVADRLYLHTDDAEELLLDLRKAGVEPRAALVRRATLEDVFLKLTGRTLRE